MQNKHVVIGGYGRVGHFLAHALEEDGYSVAVVDRSASTFEEVEGDIRGSKFLGEVFDRDVLIKAGIERAYCYCAVTSGDNSNIVSARVAKEHFNVPNVLARIYDPRRAEIYRGFGIRTIAAIEWTTGQLKAMVANPELRNEYQYGAGEVQMVQVTAPTMLLGKRLAEFEIPGELRVSAIVRNHKALLPAPGLIVEKGDRIYINVTAERLDSSCRILGLED